MTPGYRWIGVDGGGTRSRALVGDADGRELGAADGGPGLIDPADPGRAIRAVTDVARAAAEAAQAALPVRGMWAGLAGAGQEAARAAVEAGLRDAGLAEQVAVGTDVEAAHADAFGDGSGMLLVVGTGSVARAVGPGGGVVTVGGWGQLLGDEGSGYRIGLDGLRGAVRASDGREPQTMLTRVLLQATGEAEPRDLVGWAARATKGEIAALSVLVANAAREGDTVAARVIHRALGAIREHLVAVLEGVAAQQPSPGWEGRPAVAMVGGLIGVKGVLMEAVKGIALDLGCEVLPEPVVPERGALRNAISTTRCGGRSNS
ncbi:MAG: hypothetical protein OXI71_01065 [Gemmatimonadota bacterium]|nr:hypothetical protein [Gemmatimonadota bacterium]